MTTTSEKFLSVPEVAAIMNVHRNTVGYWIRSGYVKAVPKNGFVSRPQYLIPMSEVQRLQKESHVKA